MILYNNLEYKYIICTKTDIPITILYIYIRIWTHIYAKEARTFYFTFIAKEKKIYKENYIKYSVRQQDIITNL